MENERNREMEQEIRESMDRLYPKDRIIYTAKCR